MHGGKRTGAGRKAGVPNGTRSLRKEARAKLAQLVASSADPLQFVCETACNAEVDLELRIHAATVVLPYLHPRLSAVATMAGTMAPVDQQAMLETVLGRIAKLAAPATIETALAAKTDCSSEDAFAENQQKEPVACGSASLCPQGVRK